MRQEGQEGWGWRVEQSGRRVIVTVGGLSASRTYSTEASARKQAETLCANATSRDRFCRRRRRA